jgi:hypothetical protein
VIFDAKASAAVTDIPAATMNGPEFQVVQREMAPRLAAFSDQITQNAALFRRLEAVNNSPDKARLTPEQQRLIWLYYTNFVRAGARLSPDAKLRLSQINQQLAGLYTRFSQNVLAEENDQVLILKTEPELEGLSSSLRDAAAQAAAVSGFRHVTFGQHRFDPRFCDLLNGGVKPVASIAMQGSKRVLQLGFEHGQHQGHGQIVPKICRRGFDDQHSPLGIDDDVALASAFGTIHGTGSGVRPPKTARTLAESITPRL